jgi:flagellar assembly protein FliH
MDLYKANVIKAAEIVESGTPVSLSSICIEGAGPDIDFPNDDIAPVAELSEQEKLEAEREKHLSKVSDECYKKGFAEGAEFQKKEILPVLEAINAMIRMIPPIRKDIRDSTEEQTVGLAIAIAEKILNQEVTLRKDVILGVLKGTLKNISETEGMKIRINPKDFHYIMEVKKDFLQSFDGVRNVIFEEDISIKRGGAIVETMFGEVDARLENQLKEIKVAMLQL